MKLSKLLLAVAGATVLLSALASSAVARNLSTSSQNIRATWARVNFAGGFGAVECEVVLRGSFHSRTITKTVGTLSGFITEGSIIRCSRGGGTVNSESLPWHVRYRSFTGTLPTISTISATITGAEWRVREPTFGVTCTVAAASSSVLATFSLTTGTIVRADVSGSNLCGSISATLSGSTINVDNNAGTRVTITLI